MTVKDLGPNPLGNAEVITLGFLDGLWPGHSTRIITDQTIVIPLPMHPVDTQMELYEVYPQAAITVSVPVGVLLTTGLSGGIGLSSSYALPQGKTAFFGFRYSTNASAWFFMSFAVQQ